MDYLYDISHLGRIERGIFGPTDEPLPILNVGRKGDATLTRWQRSQIEILYEQDFELMKYRVSI